MRASIYDSKFSLINQALKDGKSYKDVVEMLGAGYTYSGLYNYCRNMHLKEKQNGHTQNIPRCVSCTDCLEYETTNQMNGYVCLKSRKGIPTVKIEDNISPMWCTKR